MLYIKHEGDRSTDRRSKRPKNVGNESSMRLPPNMEKAKYEDTYIRKSATHHIEDMS